MVVAAWCLAQVAGACDTSVGHGAVTVVVADKNLVPSPPGNVQRAAMILKDSGARTLLPLPLRHLICRCRRTSGACFGARACARELLRGRRVPTTGAFPCLACAGAVTVAVVPSWLGEPLEDVGVACPELPFPLELVALCMLRTLQRKNHEGGLDASERASDRPVGGGHAFPSCAQAALALSCRRLPCTLEGLLQARGVMVGRAGVPLRAQAWPTP